jgi:hypothetical protein
MPNTYTELDRVTVATSVPSVTLSSIPQGYTDLVLVSNVRINQSSSSEIYCQPNGVGTANKGFTFLIGNGSTATSGRGTNDANIRIGAGTGTSQASGIFATSISNFMGYSNTTTFKTILSRGSDTTNATQAIVGLFPSTNAITSIVIYGNNSVNILAGSTFSLYGIANADQGAAKATGGIITEDSQYWYHTFGASGTFTPKQSLSCDVLVVAGGGGGGGGESQGPAGGGGGGGAGGYLTSSNFSLTAINYTVTVGAGGNGGPIFTVGSNGSNSVFSTITSTGGGGGGRASGSATSAASNGGSGGGGGGTSVGANTNLGGAASPSGQGNAGGNSVGSRAGGGGGGANSVGQLTNANLVAGNGGSGLTSSINGISVARAGGGGGGVYNSGTAGTATDGGGAGGRYAAGTAGTGNTGGGGGGGAGSDSGGSPADQRYTGGNGGSGIVIVRYPK